MLLLALLDVDQDTAFPGAGLLWDDKVPMG